MRYADGPTAEAATVVNGARAAVWELVTDIDLPARFSGEFTGGSWLDEGPALGARFVGRNEHPALGAWETTCWVDRYEPGVAFGWSVSDPENPSASWWFTVAGDDGAVELRHGGRMGPAPSGLSIAIAAMPEKEERIVARRLEEWERNLQATVDGIKAIVEATA